MRLALRPPHKTLVKLSAVVHCKQAETGSRSPPLHAVPAVPNNTKMPRKQPSINKHHLHLVRVVQASRRFGSANRALNRAGTAADSMSCRLSAARQATSRQPGQPPPTSPRHMGCGLCLRGRCVSAHAAVGVAARVTTHCCLAQERRSKPGQVDGTNVCGNT